MKVGLVSVTFRGMLPEKIISLAVHAGLDGIEWGSDVHCPVGDFVTAEKIHLNMKKNGLESISYGTYYRLAESPDYDSFRQILATAAILGAPNIRIWAGEMDSQNVDSEIRKKMTHTARELAKIAMDKNISVSFEYHSGTLTNTQESTVQLLNEVDLCNVFTYWQPLSNTSHESNVYNIKQLAVMGKLKNIHVYHWKNSERLELSVGAHLWESYINALLSCENCVNAALLEFVRDDSIEQFFLDAKTLKNIVANCLSMD